MTDLVNLAIFAGMRFFFLLLGLYLLGLSFMPCRDRHGIEGKKGTSITMLSSNESHEDADDSCTPFCTCSCCAISINYTPLFRLVAVKPFTFSRQFPLYQEKATHSNIYNIWQPPKSLA